MTSTQFLTDLPFRTIELPDDWPWDQVGLLLGSGSSPLEVLVARSRTRPGEARLRTEWKRRKDRRPAPLLLAVIYDGKAALCGPSGEEPAAYFDRDPDQAERICRQALMQPDRHAALRFLREVLPSLEADLPGLRNEGLLATHQLRHGVRDLGEWDDATTRARELLHREGEELLRGLEFDIQRADNLTSILRARGRRRAAAVLLRADEAPEQELDRFSGLSPVRYALKKAEDEDVPWVLLLQGSRIRLYPAKLGVGVAQRGMSETYLELHTGIIPADAAGFLWLLFSADALSEGGSIERLLDLSQRFAGGLAVDLRDRIYEKVVPRLAEGLAAARGLERPTAEELAETYEAAMLLLFRLLFVAYAEDRDLLPYRWNELYRQRSLSRKAQELLALDRKQTPFDEGSSLWEEVRAVFRAIAEGHREWGIPKYDGGLFSADRRVAGAGALLDEVALSNRVFGPALRDLLLIDSPEGLGPVDFRSLGVREFGTIYEGLLESELAMAETDLVIDSGCHYRPAQPGEEVVVGEGHIYLHDRSGARKASGTYFTKPFAVDHLLDLALEPALTEHLERLDGMDDDAAGAALFVFRVADIAMGSAHFLVAAVDRIERSFAGYLSRRDLPAVRRELAKLHTSAVEALDELAEHHEIERQQLLRRLIARRCIYGVDINPTAVQLARLALWVHTFVPGLPLSLLDRNLVAGNALTGIGHLEEIAEKAREDDLPLFELRVEELVGAAMEPLRLVGRIADATAAEVERARRAMEQAREAVEPVAALCDLTAAARLEDRKLPLDLERWDDEVRETIVEAKETYAARALLAPLAPLHFPVAFPEVFLREDGRAGFDVVLGNPPWQEATIEEHAFWARHFPGLRALSQRKQESEKARLRVERPDLVRVFEEEQREIALVRRALINGAYPDMGTGDPDLYKAFCWRFWRLVAENGGRMGVVFPRSVWTAKGSTEFRQEVLENGASVELTFLHNTRGWVFDEAEHRYTIALTALRRGTPSAPSVHLRGPYIDMERFGRGKERPPESFTAAEVTGWTDTASLPLLPSEESLEIFTRMRHHPRLDLNALRQWRARPYRELDATNDKKHMDLESAERPEGFWPVYKGESFDLWTLDTGSLYGWGDPKVLLPLLQKKRERSNRRSNGAFFEFDASWVKDRTTLPCLRPRIAFRDSSRATDSRTIRAALVPPEVFCANQAQTLLWVRGDERDEAYLLGVLASIPLDWYARLLVDKHVNFFILNPFPIPRPAADDPLRHRVIELAGRLAAVDDRYSAWAAAVGVDHGPLAVDEKQDRIAELDAVVAHLYGLDERQLVHVFETFHEGWNFGERLEAVLGHYRRWTRRGEGLS